MGYRPNKWGWKATAARLLIAPVIASGAAAPALAQPFPTPAAKPVATMPAGQPVSTVGGRQAGPAAPAPTFGRTAGANAARKTDPKELLRSGRAALAAGRFDEAVALARQADANNASGKWGLFDDTPESLEKDVRSARAKADKNQAETLTKQARALFTQAAGQANDVQKLAALDQAYNLADRAVTLAGPGGTFDNLFSFGSDRPDALRKEIEAVRQPLRRKVPASAVAKAPTLPGKTDPTKPNSPILQASGTTPAGKPAAPAAADPGKAAAAKLVADGRALMRQGRLVEARSKAAEAGRTRVTFATGEDNPDALMRDVMAESKTVVDRLTKDAAAQIKAKQYDNAEAALATAHAVAFGMGFQTRPIEEQQLALRSAKGEKVAALPPAASKPVLADLTPPSQLPTKPIEPASPITPVEAVTMAKPGTSPVVPATPASANSGLKLPELPGTATAAAAPPAPTIPGQPAAPAMTPPAGDPKVAAAPLVLPAIPATAPAVAAAPTTPAATGIPPLPSITPLPVPAAPAPVVAAKIPDIAPTAPAAPATPGIPGLPALPVAAAAPVAAPGQQQLADATKELQRGDLEMARKLASQAHMLGAKDDAQKLMREIDAAAAAGKRKDAAAAFANAVKLHDDKQYDQALRVLSLIDETSLPPADREKLPDVVAKCTTGLAKITAPSANPVATAQATAPTIPNLTPATETTAPAKPAGLSDQVKALAEVDFQKLRSEGLEVETKARQAFDRGETDVAIQMLTDFTTKVKASTLSAGRQSLLLNPIDRRLEGFRIMKRQMDFYVKESRDKKDAKDRIVGRSVAEMDRKNEIGKKVREVNDLIKGHKYKEAEALALQVKNLDPEDPTLSAVYELAKRQRRVDDYAKIKDDKEKMFLTAMNAAEKPGEFLDVDNPISINVERQLNAMRRGGDNALYTRSLSMKEREIEVKLDRPYTIEFKNKSMRDAIDELRKTAGVNITTDDASLSDEQLSLDQVMISESVQDLSLRNILTIVLDKARLKYVVENDVIRVTTEKKAKGRLYTKVFSVMELVTPIPDFALADHQDINKVLQKVNNPTPAWQQMSNGSSQFNPNTGGLPGGQLVANPNGNAPAAGPFAPQAGQGVLQNNSGNGMQIGSGGSPTPSRQQAAAQLQKLITGMVRPYSWQDMGGAGKLDYYDIGGAMVVNQTADVIREVQDLLDALRRLQDLSLTVEVRIISLSESFFERVGVDFQMNIKTSGTGQFERQLTSGQFTPQPFINDINTRGTTVGWNPSQGGFTPDLDVPIRPNTYGFSVPPFGGYPGVGNGGLSVGLAFLNDIQVFMFMEAAQGDRRVNVMQAPKITLFNGQTSSVFIGDTSFFTLGLTVINVGGQVVYIPQNTAVPIGGAGNVADPTGAALGQPGVSLTIQGVVSADRKFVRLSPVVTLNALTSATVPLFPVTAFITPVFEGGSQGVPIPFTQFFQQPGFSSLSVQTTVQVPDGGTVVMGGLKTLSEGRNEFGPPVLSSIPYLNRLFRNQGIGRETKHIMMMITPRIVINSEEEVNQTGQGNVLPGAPGGY